MIESFPDTTNKEEGGHEMIDQKIIDDIRQALIDSLQESIEIYTHNGTREWVNENNCRELIEKLKAKSPVHIGGLFWGDHLDAAIYEHGFPASGSTREKYLEIWKRIEKGE